MANNVSECTAGPERYSTNGYDSADPLSEAQRLEHNYIGRLADISSDHGAESVG